jgi:hypothetical protein
MAHLIERVSDKQKDTTGVDPIVSAADILLTSQSQEIVSIVTIR